MRVVDAVDEDGCDLVPDARCDPDRLPLRVTLGLFIWLLVTVDAADAVPEAVCDLVAVLEGVEITEGDCDMLLTRETVAEMLRDTVRVRDNDKDVDNERDAVGKDV